MRREPFTKDSYIHVLKRGARGLAITNDDSDKWRFLRLLYYMNDEYLDLNWIRAIYDKVESGQTAFNPKKMFAREPGWPSRKPLVKILCYTLMPNHFHLLLKEARAGGVSLFMKKIGQSMTEHFNGKYGSKGSIFQGSYKARTIGEDRYLRYVATYIMVKNTFELYPKGGFQGAIKNFEDAWQWASSYRFSSFANYCSSPKESAVIDKDILEEIFEDHKKFKTFARDVIFAGKWYKTENKMDDVKMDDVSNDLIKLSIE